MAVALLLVILLFAAAWRWSARRRQHRRDAARHTMIVTSVPGIELEQPYGSWDADAQDVEAACGLPILPGTLRQGPPSTWGWLP